MGLAVLHHWRPLSAAAAAFAAAVALAGTSASRAAVNATGLASAAATTVAVDRRAFPVSSYGAVGDGSNEIAALRQAVAAADANGGGDVLLGPRTYVVKTTLPYETVLAPKRGTRIVGVKGSRLIADRASADGPVMIRPTGADVTVRDIAINMSRTKHGMAIRLDSTTRTRIIGTKLANVGVAGVYVAGATSHTVIRGNRFVGGGYGVLAHDASTAHDVSIIGNTFLGGARGDAIEINTPDGHATNWTIAGNAISGYSAKGPGSGLGIGIANASGVSITGNSISKIGWRAIHMENGTSDVTITGNTITAAAQEAIYAVLGSAPMRDIRIADNTLVANGFAGHSSVYFVPGGAYAPFSNVTITGNSFFLNGAPRVANVAAIQIDGFVSNAVIARNFIADQYGPYPGGKGVGISIGGSGGTGAMTIARNTVMNGALGMILYGSMSDTTAINNVLLGQTVAGIRNTATGTIRVEGNVGS